MLTPAEAEALTQQLRAQTFSPSIQARLSTQNFHATLHSTKPSRRGWFIGNLPNSAGSLVLNAFPPVQLELNDTVFPDQDQTYSGFFTRVSGRNEFRNSGNVTDGGTTLFLARDSVPTPDSLSLGDEPPSGSNITYTNNVTFTIDGRVTSRLLTGQALCASAWRATFFKSDVITSDIDSTGTFFDTQVTQSEIAFLPPPDTSISIANMTSTTAGEHELLSFQVALDGARLKAWAVEIQQNNTTIRSLRPEGDPRGPGTATGTNPVNVTVDWDGNDAGNHTVTGDFTWVAVANTTAYQPGTDVNNGATSTRQFLAGGVKASPTLEILGKPYGGAQPGIVAFGIDDSSKPWDQYSTFLRTYVYPYGRPGIDNLLTVRARNIPYDGSQGPNPPPLNVTVFSLSTGSLDERGVILNDGRPLSLPWNAQDKVYEATLQLDSGLIRDFGEGTSLYSLSCFLEDGYENFPYLGQLVASGILSLPPLPAIKTAYPFFLHPLGDSRRSFANQGGGPVRSGPPRTGSPIDVLSTSLTTTYPSGDTFFSQGDEPLVFRLPLKNDEIRAHLNVRHPAQVVTVNCHGAHSGHLMVAPKFLPLSSPTQQLPPFFGQPGTLGKLELMRPYVGNLVVNEPGPANATFFLPDSKEGAAFSNLRTLVIQACSALDHLDYNNNYHSHPDGGEDTVAQRLNENHIDDLNPYAGGGGLAWWTATQQGKSIAGGHPILLGYNRMVALDFGFLSQLYAAEYLRLANETPTPLKDLEIYAWLSANLIYARKWDKYQMSSLAACAWDGDFYYYITHDRDQNKGLDDPPGSQLNFWVALKEPKNGSVVKKIPRNLWRQKPLHWVQGPEFAVPVGIP